MKTLKIILRIILLIIASILNFAGVVATILFSICFISYVGLLELGSTVNSIFGTSWSPDTNNMINGIFFYSIFSIVCFFLKYLILDTWKADDKIHIVSNNKYETFEQNKRR